MKMSKKKIVLCIILLLGIIPVVYILGNAIYGAFIGVPEFTLFLPPRYSYYGWDAFCYVLMWAGIFAVAYWYITIPWVICLVIVPFVLLIRDKEKERNN